MDTLKYSVQIQVLQLEPDIPVEEEVGIGEGCDCFSSTNQRKINLKKLVIKTEALISQDSP